MPESPNGKLVLPGLESDRVDVLRGETVIGHLRLWPALSLAELSEVGRAGGVALRTKRDFLVRVGELAEESDTWTGRDKALEELRERRQSAMAAIIGVVFVPAPEPAAVLTDREREAVVDRFFSSAPRRPAATRGPGEGVPVEVDVPVERTQTGS